LFLIYSLLIVDFILLGMALSFTSESIQEKEPRSPGVGVMGVVICLIFVFLILWVPVSRVPIAILFGLICLVGILCLIPGPDNIKALKGAAGYLKGKGKRFDERDIVFARQRMNPNGSPEQKEVYRMYYSEHPELEGPDDKRRRKGLLGTPGRIDSHHPSNIAMLHASFDLPDFLGIHARKEFDENLDKVPASPEKYSDITKKLLLHAGADMVGICKINPLWIYSHRGEIHFNNYDEYGEEITDLPPYAVVFLTEMNWEHVSAAPHTPSVIESANNYAKGSYLSTMLAQWFIHMGYRGIPQHSRRYDTLLPPLAVDAGLGEVGRHGYLIAPRYGARVRVFATLTDMPLVPDKPISIGVEEFCQKCKKCADSCPSQSIPSGEKTIYNDVEKWKLDETSCFEFWSKVGTDCSICMAICPFSRPDTFSHTMVRWLMRRSYIAKTYFPIFDNYIYGKKWQPRNVSNWINYQKGIDKKEEIY